MSNLKISDNLKTNIWGFDTAEVDCMQFYIPVGFYHCMEFQNNILGRQASLCATTSHAMSTAYTTGQCLVDSSRSTWSRVLSFFIMNFVPDIT